MSGRVDQIVQEMDSRGMMTPRMRQLHEEMASRGMSAPLQQTVSGQTVLTTPIPRPEQKLTTLPDEMGPALVLDFPEMWPDNVLQAADAGVLYDVPASSGHFLSSLAFDRKNEMEAYRQSLNREGEDNVQVRIGPVSGEIEYFVPEQNRFSIARPPNSTLAEMQALGGLGITLGTEAGAGILSAALTKSPTMAALGTGGGAILGELMRLELGRRMGINQDITAEQEIGQAVKIGALTAGAGVAGEKLFKFARFAHNLISGRMAQQDLIDSGLDIEDAMRLQDEINERLGDAQFKFNLAQATNDEELLIIQDFLKRSREYSAQFGEFSDKQQIALQQYWKSINTPYRTRQTPEQVTDAVLGVAETRVGREVTPADAFAHMKRAQLQENLSSLTERPPEQLGEILRGAGAREQKAFTDWSKAAAKDLNNAVGDAPFIENTNTHSVVKSIGDESKKLLFDSLKRPRQAVIGAPPQAVEEAAEEVGEEAVDSAVAKVWDENARFTFEEAWLTVSALKALERASGKGMAAESVDTGTVKRLIGALERDIDEGFASGESGAAELYETFKRQYRTQKRMLDEGTVGKLMERKGGARGRFVLSDEQAFRRLMLPGDVRAARELSALTRNNPEASDAVREGLAEMYRRDVIKEQRVDVNAHDRFMRDHGGQMSVFFSKGEMGRIRERKGIESALRARERDRDEALKNANDTFAGRLTNIKDIDQLARIAMDRGSPGQASELVSILSKTPDVLRGVRAKVREKMHELVMGPHQRGQRIFSHVRFNDFLNGKAGETGHRANLANLFGEEYVADLDTLNQALQVTMREARFPNRSNTAFWKDTVKNLTRAYVGLFTRPGRFITAVDRLTGRTANRVLSQTILNPQDLRALVELQGVDMRTEKARAVLSSLGATALLAGPKPGDRAEAAAMSPVF